MVWVIDVQPLGAVRWSSSKTRDWLRHKWLTPGSWKMTSNNPLDEAAKNSPVALRHDQSRVCSSRRPVVGRSQRPPPAVCFSIARRLRHSAALRCIASTQACEWWLGQQDDYSGRLVPPRLTSFAHRRFVAMQCHTRSISMHMYILTRLQE